MAKKGKSKEEVKSDEKEEQVKEEEVEEVEEAEGGTKKEKKLNKKIDGTVISITVKGMEKMEFDFSELPSEIQAKLGPFGLGHKLGDSAAGKAGSEAVEAVQHVWNGLMAGDWSTRAPAGEKISKKEVMAKVSNLSPEEQAIAFEMLKKLGISMEE